MRYAIEQPERLRSLILVNTNPASSSLQEAANARLQDRITPADSAARMEVISSNAFRDREPEALVAYFRVAFRPSFYDPALVSKLSFFFDDHYVTNSGMLQRLGADASFQAFDLHPFLEEVPVPVLILHGVHDPVSLDEITPMHEAFPDSRLVLMEESGHFPFVEKPDAFNAHVRQFLIEISE
jgi:proline iminopeptidase